ncbi:MAG: 16S rRNA (cytosine(967)-C(5))-methyltransferase RsmB, partial [Acidobacteria bacterium]
MAAPARSIAFDVLCRVSIEGGYSDYALNAPSVARLQARDRNLVTEIVYGTLRWQGWLDFLLSRVSARGWEEVDPRVGVLLRMSLYQISRLERIPAYAAVHEAVEIARARVGHGAGRFVNAILRRLARERPWQAPGLQDALPETARVSLPEWLWRRWAARFGTAQALAYA